MDASGIIYLLEKHAKPRPVDRVDKREIRIAATKAAFHRPAIRGQKTPKYVLDNVKAEYDLQPSMAATARVFGISKSWVSLMFRKYKVPYRKKTPSAKIVYKGISYRFQLGRYYATGGNKKPQTYLHHVIWEEANGPIPDGCFVVFRTKNYQDVSVGNLKLVTRKEFLAKHLIRYRYPKAA